MEFSAKASGVGARFYGPGVPDDPEIEPAVQDLASNPQNSEIEIPNTQDPRRMEALEPQAQILIRKP